MRLFFASIAMTCPLACGSAQSAATCDPNAAGVTSVVMIAVAADFSVSAIGALPLDGSPATLLTGTALGTDPVLASSHAQRFFIARDQDTLFQADGCGRSLLQISTREIGDSQTTNPQDVAVAPDGSLWIARGVGLVPPLPSIFITGPAAGAPTTIDLSTFDADGNPDASSIRILGSSAFVALERLTNDEAIQPSMMAVIDTTTLKVSSSLTLAGRNPFGLMKETPDGNLWLADPGNFFDATEADAGVEIVNTTTLTSTLVLKESDLGASVIEVAPTIDGTCAAAILADPTTANQTSLISFSTDGKTASNVTTLIAPTPSFDLRGLFWTQGGALLVADDRAGANGFPVHTFRPSSGSCALTQSSDLFVETVPALSFSN